MQHRDRSLGGNAAVLRLLILQVGSSLRKQVQNQSAHGTVGLCDHQVSLVVLSCLLDNPPWLVVSWGRAGHRAVPGGEYAARASS